MYAAKVNRYNKEIQLPTFNFFDYLDVIVIIHHTDTISVAISCSCRPIKIKEGDITVTIDGEPIGILPATFQVYQNALTIKM
jgi:diacylglycerol kinase family enzyme